MTTKPLWLLPLVLLSACDRKEAPAQQAPPKPAVQVTVSPAESSDWPELYEATGTVRSRMSAVVAARIMGHLREVRVQLGDRVVAGQRLALLDAQDLEAGSRRAEAGREEARSMVPEAESGITAARAQLELAQTTQRRMQELFNSKSISPQEMDEANARVKAAQAAVDMAQARRRQLDSRIAQADQEVKASGIVRGYAEVTAPFAGIITVKTAEPGVLAMPGTPLFTVDREGAFRLEAQVEESRLYSITPGHAVSVTLEGLEKPLELKVSEIVPSIDPMARAGIARIDLPAVKNLRAGAFGRATFSGQPTRVVTVPVSAVVEHGQLQSVFVVDGAVARSRLVTLGITREGRREVLSGLTENERVILNPAASLQDGAPVEVRP